MKNIYPKDFFNIFFVIQSLSNDILRKINDYYLKIHDNYQLKKEFYNIDFVYMHSIVLDMAKLLSVNNNDKSGFLKLKKIAPKEFKERIVAFEIKYRGNIDKIKNNRSKIIAHVDISDVGSYFKMGFSKVEIDRMIKDFTSSLLLHENEVTRSKLEKDLRSLEAKSLKDERYSPSDFYGEKEIFRIMINEISQIVNDLNKYYYSQEK